MAAKKTFKIGEYAKGGVISVEIQGKIITVIGRDWDYSKGSNKSSNQDNAKEFIRGTAEATDPEVRRKLFMFISDLTTSYYTDQIIEWIASKVELEKGFF